MYTIKDAFEVIREADGVWNESNIAELFNIPPNIIRDIRSGKIDILEMDVRFCYRILKKLYLEKYLEQD